MNRLSQIQIALIKQKIILDQEKFIVRLNVLGNKSLPFPEYNENVYCVNNVYEILWQIKAEPTGFDEDPFVNINFDGKTLIARNFSGFKYKVNLQNGETEMIGWDK